ncbi:uncharacterized protein PHACADRAFT_119752 [Phanerochaete carnosa HHB-10118-sp]|uniref:SPIN90/Ldb17 leucine-rich domain-containing protein n=1 Tax=Phanerochaete carnosa (strain HHB-10118-sp) TaxID=650164 RepID=K5WDQ0_PHACS|nr:uncharacterized protein PHACADRAFT_119752 [Phanerochaete carnosa HHB-10118-sp]EKM57390.1 hypothetical protein PHACADRAFT_119752 [Phanerochaete carnosa HHB-10118-sp]
MTLDQLDASLRQFTSFCGCYHEQYLQTPLQLEHACDLLLNSELFTFHSERMCDILLDDAQTSTDPHYQLILYTILLGYGRRHASFLRSHKRWRPIIPLLMDHVRLDINPELEDAGVAANRTAMPIEAKLRLLSVNILYEVCRVQKLSLSDLRIFDDTFIEHLFEVVEQTRDHADETFNYAVIKLIVALNEQFMVASLQPHTQGHAKTDSHPEPKPEEQNRVLRMLMARLGSCMTLGENLIFMLNRAGRTAEDLVMQLLVLKLLYLLFTTKGCAEFFYTNDLRVLVDVFLREILNLDEENESLRHTYLRVLHPLLTKTQLRSMPYKRAQIVHVLESLIENENIRDINPTTKRLVKRCLSGDWCAQYRKPQPKYPSSFSDTQSVYSTDSLRSPALDSVSAVVASTVHTSGSNTLLAVSDTVSGGRVKSSLKASRSHENLQSTPTASKEKEKHIRLGSNDSHVSLPRLAAAAVVEPSFSRRRDRPSSLDVEVPSTARRTTILDDSPVTTERVGAPEIRITSSPFSPTELSPLDPLDSTAPASYPGSPVSTKPRKAAPAPPPRRRKPPAIPTRVANGITITTIATSASTPATPRVHSPLRNGAVSR